MSLLTMMDGFLKIRMTDANELDALLDADGYQAHIDAEHD